ncbi:MAG: hypothetical protein B7X58_08740 [Marinobacter sp. 34-60-7]|nr:MAG: hypothetical protein B7X58_08740 [Marinobacter sp. 34-60-7]
MGKQRFRYSASILKTSHVAVFIGLLLAFLIGSFLWLELPNLQALDFRQLISDQDGNVAFEWYLIAICAVLGGLVMYFNGQIRLEIDNEALRIHVPPLTGLGLIGFTTGKHRIPLTSIRKIELAPVTGIKNLVQALQHSKLIVVTDTQTYRLQPYNYLKVGQPDHRIGFRSAFGKPKTQAETLIAEAPLVKALSELTRGEAEFSSRPTDRTGPLANHFDLTKHRGILLLLVLLTGLGTYALVDYVLLTEFLILGDLPLWPFISSGLVAGALGVRLGRGAPAAERFGITALLCAVAMLATFPGLQRYTLLVSPEPQTVDFQNTETAYFTNPQYPDIDQRQSNIPEYWQSFPAGDIYTFNLHESGLGFVLISMSSVYAESRAFYGAQSPTQ